MYAYGVNTNMNASPILKYNLQFFAEGEENDNTDDSINPNGDSSTDTNTDAGVDAAAFAEIISEKDKKLEELADEVRKLQKSNAELIVRVNAGSKDSSNKSFEENLMSLNGWKPRKE